MDVKFIYTQSDQLDALPVEDGQLIILTDIDALYYDMLGVRHISGSAEGGRFVSIDTEQTITATKIFDALVDMRSLIQGQGCKADDFNHAEGYSTQAVGNNNFAHAEGGLTQAREKYSHSEGEGTKATGRGAHASGLNTVASGPYASTSGMNTYAMGKGSTAQGAGTTASMDFSTVVGTGNEPVVGDLFQVGNGNVTTEDGEMLPDEDQTFSNALRVTKDGRAIVQTDVELDDGTKLSDRESVNNKVTAIGLNPTDTEYPSAKAVKDCIDSMPEPMIFKGTLGVDGTITSLPTADASNEGYTYKVITSGTYQNVDVKVGDTLISNGSDWVFIPSGDEPSGTVTNVAAQGTNGILVTGGPITDSGTLKISGVNATQSSNGMMTAEDKKKLDSVVQVYVGTEDPSASLGKNGDIYIKLLS